VVNCWSIRASKPTGKCAHFGFAKEPISCLFEFHAGNRTQKSISDDHHERPFVLPTLLRDVRAPHGDLIAIPLTSAAVPDSSATTSPVSS
jgi:hypothetical protein